jgi:hypothetical protein
VTIGSDRPTAAAGFASGFFSVMALLFILAGFMLDGGASEHSGIARLVSGAWGATR